MPIISFLNVVTSWKFESKELLIMNGKNVFAQAQTHMHRVHQRLGSSPLILWFLGVLVLLLWACGSIVQIQTSEYLALGSQYRVAGVAWSILLQPWWMISGQAPIQEVTAWMYGWVVEVITLVFALALSVAVVKISTANPKLGKGFVIFGFLLIGLNTWADYSSSPGSTPLVQGLIALALGLIVVCGLPLGVGLLEHGFEEL
jgi:hypothetical protein